MTLRKRPFGRNAMIIVDNSNRLLQANTPLASIVGFVLENNKQILQVKSPKDFQLRYWLTSLQNLGMQSYGQIHRFGSFAPIRDYENVELFVDAQEYFSRLFTVLENAKHTIFIEGWWLSPELHLLRPPFLHSYSRLDHILKKKAQQGVKIYVIVFKEVTVALSIDSADTKRTFQALDHTNIMVQRHPDHSVITMSGNSVFFWAHHEKLVIVDRMVAFVGGLNLCYGRYDTSRILIVLKV